MLLRARINERQPRASKQSDVDGISAMIIKTDSSLRNLPSGLDPTQTKMFDAIRISIEFADLSYSRLTLSLENLARSHESRLGVSALQDGWAIIDSVHRLRCLVNRLPGYKQKAPSKQKFLRATRTITALRNSIQHLDEDIQTIVETFTPVLGSLSWIRVLDRENKMFEYGVFIPGQWADVNSQATQELPAILGNDIDDVTLRSVKGTVNLSKVIGAVAALADHWHKQIEKQFLSTPRNKLDAYMFVKGQYLPDDVESA